MALAFSVVRMVVWKRLGVELTPRLLMGLSPLSQ